MHNLYHAGTDIVGAFYAGEEPTIITNAFMAAQMAAVNADVVSLQRDIWREFPGPTNPFSLAFGAWKQTWDDHYQKMLKSQTPLFGNMGTHNNFRATKEFDRALQGWKDKYAALAKKSPTAAEPRSEDTGFPWGKIALGGAGLVVLGIGGVYLKRRFFPKKAE